MARRWVVARVTRARALEGGVVNGCLSDEGAGRRRWSRSHFPPFGRGEEELERERHRAGLSATCGGSGASADRPLPGAADPSSFSLQGAQPPPWPGPGGVWLPAAPTSGLVSHNARRPPLALWSLAPRDTWPTPLSGGRALAPPGPCLQPPGALEPPRPLFPSAPPENLSCPRGQPLESCPVWGLAPPQAQGGAPPPPSDLVSPSVLSPAASSSHPRAAATRTLPPPPPVTSCSVQPRFSPRACTSLPWGRRSVTSGGCSWGAGFRGPPGVWN
ncbi:Phosphatidylinositol 4-Phosphate 3-Kinase C2 Domain-Containing Subunit Alpha [Manis pentadactyla]|nr:Phosphatidylinositol 4-Phosphate 3-Kinase C2 Domain-Containing Subunit Alpha [Manis pentadactyla]